MSTAQTPYDAVIEAASGVTSVRTALEAELLGAALLGGVYAVADAPGGEGADRASAVHEFIGRFLAHTARKRGPAARALRSVFATLDQDAPGAARVRPGTNAPAWASQLGRVKLVGSWAYGDVYGDQTSYLAIFSYDDAESGGGEHAAVALVDHNIGIVKDLFVTEPGGRVLEEVRRAAESDEFIWLTEVDPATLRAQVDFYLDVTDGLAVLPEEGSLATDRALVGARLATLPAGGPRPAVPSPADPGTFVPEFLDSPEAAGLDRSTPEADAAVQYALTLIFGFVADAPDADPLRWSPAVAGLFLLDWVHRRAVLDGEDVARLPDVLRAWAASATREAIDTMTPEFVRLHTAGGTAEIPRPR